MYANGNPLKFTNPTGEIAWFVPIILGAIIGAASYTISYGIQNNWKFDKWDLGEFGKSILFGAIGGAVSFGIGGAFLSGAGQFGSKFAMEAARALAHGASQMYLEVFKAMVFGGNVTPEQFAITFLTAGIASGASSALSALPGKLASTLSQSLLGQMAFGGIIGGLTESAMGGNFFHGFATGAIVSGLNHGLHKMAENSYQKHLDKINEILIEINEFNPLANLSNGIKGLTTGTDFNGRQMAGIDPSLAILGGTTIGSGKVLTFAAKRATLLTKFFKGEFTPKLSKYWSKQLEWYKNSIAKPLLDGTTGKRVTDSARKFQENRIKQIEDFFNLK